MGLVLLVLAYALTAALLALAVRGLPEAFRRLRSSRRAGTGGRASAGAAAHPEPVWTSRWAPVALALLPLLFTAPGFLPKRALAPTNALVHHAPWVGPELRRAVDLEATPVNPYLFDGLTQMIPWRHAGRSGILFDASHGAGAALLGNGQSALLHPTEIVARALPRPRGTAYSQAARLLVAVWGLFVLLRVLGASEWAASAGAAAWCGSGFLELWRLHPHSLVAATAPWIVAAALVLLRRPGPLPALVLGVAGAAGAAAGHPETLLHVVVFAALLVLALAPARHGLQEGARRLAAGAPWALVAALVALLLSAPVLLPFVDNLRVSREWEKRSSGHSPDRPVEVPLASSVARLGAVVTPVAYGPLGEVAEDAPHNVVELAGGSLGTAALVLLPVALAAVAGRRRRERTVWLALGLVGLLVGAHTPWISKPFGAMPLLGISLLSRLGLWFSLAGSVLAGLAVDGLRAGRGGRALVWGGSGAAVLLAVAGGLLPGALLPRGVPLEALSLALVLAAGFLLVGLVRRAAPDEAEPPAAPEGGGGAGRLGRRRLSRGRGAEEGAGERSPRERGVRRPASPWASAGLFLLLLALAGSRTILFSGWVPVVPAASFYPRTPAVDRVASRLAEEPSAGYRVAGIWSSLLPNSASFLGLEDVRIYDPMTYGPYHRFLEILGKIPSWGGLQLVDPVQPALDFLGVRFVFNHPSGGEPDGLAVAYAGPDALVYESPRVLPRAYLPREVEVVGDPEAALAAAGSIGDFAARVAAAGAGLPPPGVYPNGEARVTSLAVEPGRIVAEVEAGSPALLATSQPAIPGWLSRLDGEPVEPVSVLGAFLGVGIPAGEHRVELVYAPAAWRWGLAAFGLGVLAGLLLSWLAVRPASVSEARIARRDI